MMKVNFTDQHVILNTDDPRAEHLLLRYHNAAKVKAGFRLPKTLWVLRELLKSFPILGIDATFVHAGKSLKEMQDRLLYVKRNPIQIIDDQLRPYQREDVGYLKHLEAAGIFNEPRTGKTPTAITLMKEIGGNRNLVIAPASLIYNWEAEIKKWWPEADVFVAAGTEKNRMLIYDRFSGASKESSAVLIVSKDTLKAKFDSGLFAVWKPFDTCFVDEAHFLRALAGAKNKASAQAKAILQVKAKRRYALTGTPTVKRSDEIFGILHFLYPKEYPSYWQFVDRYFEQSKDWMGHNVVDEPKKHRIQELQESIGMISVQRKRKDVMKWLPDKQRSTLTLPLEGKQRKLYEQMVTSFVSSDGSTEVDAANVITQLMRLRQLSLDPRLIGFDVPGAKTVALLDYLEDHTSPVVIMSWFTSYLKLLESLMKEKQWEVGLIHGEMSPKEKNAAASAFQAGKTRILLCNIITAGVGFTLDRADHILFTDKAWNPAENEQAEDRICPTSEDRNHKHQITSMICKDSVEERIEAILARKESVTEMINKGGADAIKRLIHGG